MTGKGNVLSDNIDRQDHRTDEIKMRREGHF